MPSCTEVLVCSALALVFYSSFGLFISRRLAPGPVALLLAPITGWAVHSALALPVFMVIGLQRATVLPVFALSLLVALAALYRRREPNGPLIAFPVAVGLIAAALLSVGVAMGVLPKLSGESVTFSGPVFDHAKTAIVDEMARLGVPPGNPFIAGDGPGGRLAYYYLWHFSAAELALLAGVSGWAADAALTWFTGFASLAALMGLALAFGARPWSALWIVALAATASLRPLIGALIDRDTVQDFTGAASGLGGWLFQTSWAPQHVASATTAILAVFMLVRLVEKPSWAGSIILALTMAASFQSSTWIGGIVLPFAAIVTASFMIERADAKRRRAIVLHLAAAAVLALVLIAPFFYDQLAMAALRGGASPIAVRPYTVLVEQGGFVRDAANLAAYWLVFLVVEFPAFYLTGLVSIYWLSRSHLAPDRRDLLLGFTVVLGTALVAAWLLQSTLVKNNDLGWRAILPAVLLLIAFAAAGLAELAARRRHALLIAPVILVLLGLPGGIRLVRHNLVGAPEQTSSGFIRSAALWQAVRQYAAPTERVANNPLYFAQMTPWPANISWALLANRRSCYAGRELTEPFAALSRARQDLIDAQFARVFSGDADADDIAQLASQYGCAVVVLTPEDGAWSRDPFAASASYRLVEGNAGWRIYKLVKLAAN